MYDRFHNDSFRYIKGTFASRTLLWKLLDCNACIGCVALLTILFTTHISTLFSNLKLITLQTRSGSFSSTIRHIFHKTSITNTDSYCCSASSESLNFFCWWKVICYIICIIFITIQYFPYVSKILSGKASILSRETVATAVEFKPGTSSLLLFQLHTLFYLHDCVLGWFCSSFTGMRNMSYDKHRVMFLK